MKDFTEKIIKLVEKFKQRKTSIEVIVIESVKSDVAKELHQEEMELKMQQYGDYVCNSVLQSQKPIYKSSKEYLSKK